MANGVRVVGPVVRLGTVHISRTRAQAGNRRSDSQRPSFMAHRRASLLVGATLWEAMRNWEALRHFLVKTEASEDAERPPSLAIRSAGYRSQLERPPRLTVIATSKIRIRRDHFLSKTRRPRLWPETEDKHGIGPGWGWRY